MESSKSKNKTVSLTLIGNFDLPTVLQRNMMILHESYRTFYETLLAGNATNKTVAYSRVLFVEIFK